MPPIPGVRPDAPGYASAPAEYAPGNHSTSSGALAVCRSFAAKLANAPRPGLTIFAVLKFQVLHLFSALKLIFSRLKPLFHTPIHALKYF